MKKDLVPQAFKFKKDLKGISLKALKEHYKLYEGYVRKTVEIRSDIMEVELKEANATYSRVGEAKREETYAVNAMKLHEFYFDELGGNGVPAGKIVSQIESDFGSFDYWRNDFVATGMSARGWAVLAFDLGEKKLRNYGMDSHNLGPVWDSRPILILDVYEHAYFMDYGTNRKAYIEAYLNNLNWEKIDTLWSAYEF
ncbi:MAG: superoxide dismutase [Patescibacteria group bacterium]|nr:superoxide dismutase [Patescibacteria group bacterium]